MDFRPIGIAAWIAAVVAVAACGPREEGRALTDADATIARTAAQAREAREAPAATTEGAGTRAMGAGPAPAAGTHDGVLTMRVKAALAAAHDLNGARIDVDTRDGVVTLSGSVPTVAIKARASEIAKATRDVQGVNDQLTMAAG